MCKYIDELKKYNFKKNAVKKIAQKYHRKESELKKYFSKVFFENIANSINLHEISNMNLDAIEDKLVGDDQKRQFNFIKSDLNKIIQKSLYIALCNGFPVNINNIQSGIMTSNAGDSAEFIFVARAILAGFNCSSVDVRSSSYDAIIDYRTKLLRVQVKGISDNIISFKGRARGGKGIDHTHERNIGKRITSKDCDIYVAVDKQVGICYIIPMKWGDDLTDKESERVKINDILNFKENWDIIKENA